MRNSRGWRSTGVGVLALGLLLSGCSSPTPSPAVTAQPAPPVEDEVEETAAPPTASTLVIAGAELRVLDEAGAVIDSLPYSTDPAAATAFLSDLLDSDPVVSESGSDDNSCVGDTTISLWDDALAMVYGELFLPDGQQVWVRATAAEVGGLAVQTPQGATVGQPIDLLEANIPPEQRTPAFESQGIVYLFVDYDVASGEWKSADDPEYGSGDYWGARARGENGTVAMLSAPSQYVDTC